MEDYAEMQALAEEEESEAAESTSFVVALDYTLTPDGLTVTIPHAELAETGGAKIRTIQLLPFFGAAGTAEKGVIVVPDGSGALILPEHRYPFSSYETADYTLFYILP